MTKPLSQKIERDLEALDREGVPSPGYRQVLEHMLGQARMIEELRGPTAFDSIYDFLDTEEPNDQTL